MWLEELEIPYGDTPPLAGTFLENRDIPMACELAPGQRRRLVSPRDENFRVRPGRIRDPGFVGQVMAAARKAGHTGKRFGAGKRTAKGASFGRGRRLKFVQASGA